MRHQFYSHHRSCGPSPEPRQEKHHCGRPGFGEFRRAFREGRGGPGGPGRFFESGDLRYVILQLIAEKSRHGYELIKSIEEKFEGAYSPSPGVVYPMLTLLEEMGYATVTAEGQRKLYSITPEGAKALEENRAATDAIFERIRQAAAGRSSERSPQILRSLENLRMILRMKVGTLTPEQANRITDLIDAAAREIERL